MDNKLGKTIRILRQAKSLKVSELAKLSEVSVPYISLVESGDRQPSIEVLKRIAAKLGVPSDALLILGMNDDTLKSADKRTADLTDTVNRLMAMERKLESLMGMEYRLETKRDSRRAPR
ncbi:helix-turn-helix domain-containing protein [Botrimarina mediterranea]|uniref:Anaerobic benzoate catabolism transcriptional regulator n=1 Tax=Botrimarina mediterranea TaxID=2528022 RepID=A0A518K5F7_9BACT|nr:helix-turn-helix transcriptional regulator [Botrimarina mediterranea]QDV73033.1 anaerobic benzoate catabolism transcriptional regulator [Botrimarina mediterranea]QDV77606.1 anaerobic benzoate catabolism transcriptional regulator [Planctomycetes bacterium K2D]